MTLSGRPLKPLKTWGCPLMCSWSGLAAVGKGVAWLLSQNAHGLFRTFRRSDHPTHCDLKPQSEKACFGAIQIVVLKPREKSPKGNKKMGQQKNLCLPPFLTKPAYQDTASAFCDRAILVKTNHCADLSCTSDARKGLSHKVRINEYGRGV